MATTYTTTLTQAIQEIFSKEIMFTAQPIMKFEQFATKKLEPGIVPGLTINMMKYNNLTAGGVLNEAAPMTTQALTASQIAITLAEYGNAVQVSELLLQSSFDDIMASASRLLGMDYAKVLDSLLRDAVLTTSNVVYANGRTARIQIAAGDYFDLAVLRDAVETLSSLNAPKVNGDFYVCFLSPHQARRLRDDSNFVAAIQFGDPGRLYIGEIGRIEDVIFIETTQMPILAGAGAGAPAADVYQAVLIGDNAYGIATSLPVELRDNGVEDFGRTHSLAWYSIQGCGLIEESNCVRIETN